MPLYDFECEECDYIEEILTRSAGNAEIVLTCPECEKETMKLNTIVAVNIKCSI